MNDQLFTLINERLNKIEGKLDELINWKWQLYGRNVIISSIMGVVGTLVVIGIQYYLNKQ